MVVGRQRKRRRTKVAEVFLYPAQSCKNSVFTKRSKLEGRFALGPTYQQFDFVFATEIGTPLLSSNLSRRHFKPILKKAGLSKEIRLYDLRHTCATLLLCQGQNPKVVAERLVHSTIVLTLDTYAYVLLSMQEGATDALEAMLFRRRH